MIRSAALVCFGVLALTALYGCAAVNRLRPSTHTAEQRAAQAQVLQLKVMRFADQYAGIEEETINRVQAEMQSPEDRLRSQRWKLQQAQSAYTIASGPNPQANALDMVVLATLSRMVLDDPWVSNIYGSRARPVQEAYHSLEADAWQLLTGVLTDPQIARLRASIEQWRARHPEVRYVAYIHFSDFAKAAGIAGSEESRPDNLLSFVGLNPLSGLDPAVQQIAQTRQLAERSIYYMQRMPDLLHMQVELLTYQSAVMPEARSLLDDVNRVSLVGSSSDRLVTALPVLLDRQREALIKDLIRAVNEESKTAVTLTDQLRATLQAGTDTANAVHGALDTVDKITSQFAATRTPPAPNTPQGPPFDIREYTAMLERATLAVRELNTLAGSAETMLPTLRLATQDASARMEAVENHLFLLLMLLVLFTALAAVLATLAYRYLVAHLERGNARFPGWRR